MGALIDLTGQRFGRLTVIHRMPSGGHGSKARWWCKCDCGNEIEADGGLLRNGNIQSCGCYRKDLIRETKTKDMVGQSFGSLTVLRRDDSKSKDGRAYWICRCECGNEVSVSGKNLRSGWTKSCGCKSREMAAEKMRKDYTGMRFGRLTVVARSDGRGGSKRGWICRCDCGNMVTVSVANLCGGQISCGCARFDIGKYSSEHNRTHGASYKTPQNESDHRLYEVWHSMKGRCTLQTDPNYKNYGGRGITVCDEWANNFVAFRDWAYSNGYVNAQKGQCTIDRIDVNGNYEPSNCRWVTIKQQANNKRTNRYFEIDGVTHTLAEWSEIYGVSRKLVRDRLCRGWDIQDALTKPKRIINKNV